MDGSGGTLSRGADIGSEENPRESVEPHIEIYNIRGNYTRVGTVDGDTLVLEFLGEFYGEKRQGKF